MAIHPTAIIDPKAELDPSVEVGPYCVVDGNVRLGAGCRLIHNVYLTGWTTIGEGCELHSGCVIGHAPQDVKYKGERSFCRIGCRNIFRENVTIHRGTIPESATTIGNDCFLLAGSHVAHNCTVGNSVTLINNALLAGHVSIGDKVTVGGNAGFHQFLRVGMLAMVGGMATVSMDVLPFALVGHNGRIAGLNRVGMRRNQIPWEDQREVRLAYRQLFHSGRLWDDAVRHLAETVQTTAGRELVTFLSAESKRGYVGLSRRKTGQRQA